VGRRQRPTNAELAILHVLWRRGPSTVRQVHAALGGDKGVGYTTVLKLLQIMAEKGLVARDASARSHVYVARVSEAATQRRLVSDLLERAFGGSALRLVQQALSAKRVSRSELLEIRRLLDGWNGGET
jgi:predicted transcriptional regulator